MAAALLALVEGPDWRFSRRALGEVLSTTAYRFFLGSSLLGLCSPGILIGLLDAKEFAHVPKNGLLGGECSLGKLQVCVAPQKFLR